MTAWRNIFGILLLATYIGAGSQYAYSHYDDKRFSHFAYRPTTPDIEEDCESRAFSKSVIRCSPSRDDHNIPQGRPQIGPHDSLDVAQDRLDGVLRPPPPQARPLVAQHLARNGLPVRPPIDPIIPERPPGLDHGSKLADPEGGGPTEPASRGQEKPKLVLPGIHWERASDVDVTAQAIIKIAEYVDYHSASDILKKVGYSPNYTGWTALPAERQLEIAYRDEEKAAGGGKNLLVRVVDELAKSYESIIHDEVVNRFLISPRNPLALGETRPIDDPSVLTDIINNIARYCCGVLGGRRGLLMYHLSLPQTVAEQILISSKSNIEALEIGLFTLPPPVAITRIRRIVEVLQQNYDAAIHDEVLKKAISVWHTYQGREPYEQTVLFYFMMRELIKREYCEGDSTIGGD